MTTTLESVREGDWYPVRNEIWVRNGACVDDDHLFTLNPYVWRNPDGKAAVICRLRNSKRRELHR